MTDPRLKMRAAQRLANANRNMPATERAAAAIAHAQDGLAAFDLLAARAFIDAAGKLDVKKRAEVARKLANAQSNVATALEALEHALSSKGRVDADILAATEALELAEERLEARMNEAA